jgi:porin
VNRAIQGCIIVSGDLPALLNQLAHSFSQESAGRAPVNGFCKYSRAATALHILAGLALAVAACTVATAQTINRAPGTEPGQEIAPLTAPTPTQAITPPPAEHFFGTWGGVQPTLETQGIDIQLDAITEFAGNLSGGVKQGSTFASQIGLQADANWERLAGITGLSTHIIVVERSGSSDSQLFGDNLLPVQEIYGSGGDVAIHLVSAYAQETLFHHGLDVALGRMNVEADFGTSALYCNFLNNALCGDPKALPGGDIGHSAYPDAVWAARIRVRPTPAFYIETGLYQVNQGLYGDANFRTGFKLDNSQTSGVYLPVQIGWLPAFGDQKLPGHYKLGFGYDMSGGYQDFRNVLATEQVPGYSKLTRTGNTQYWALADQMLFRQGPGPMDGLIALGGYVRNDPNNTAYAQQYFLALLDKGFWQARMQDTVGVLATYATVSRRLAAIQRIEQSLGLPYSNGATGVQTHEMVLEANYAIHLMRGLTFQPDFQYVLRPNAETNIHDAVVLGFRAHLSF